MGGTLYCKMTPCYACAKMIINAGIVRVVPTKDYHVADRTKAVFSEAGIKLDILDENIETYANQ
jgi:deoxycytidylate deaminase